MRLGNTPRSARLLLAALGLCGLLGSPRSARAEEPTPAAPEPRVFDGTAGITRLAGYGFAAQALIAGVVYVVRSSNNADDMAELAAPLSRDFGIDVCRRPLAVNVAACANLAASVEARDHDGDYAVGFFVMAGVVSAATTASIWLWRTPGPSGWPPDWLRVTPTVGPKSGGVILQGAW